MRSRWRHMGIGMTGMALSLTGGWDQRTLTSRASALALPVIPTTRDMFRWTFYFPNPAITISNSLSNLSSSQQLYPASALAPSINLAIERVQSQLVHDHYLRQLEHLMVSPHMRASALSVLLNGYNANGIDPKTVYLMADPGQFGRQLPVSPQGTAPSNYLTRYLSPLALWRRLWQVWNGSVTSVLKRHSALLRWGVLATAGGLLLRVTSAVPSTLMVRELLFHWLNPLGLGWAYVAGAGLWLLSRHEVGS